MHEPAEGIGLSALVKPRSESGSPQTTSSTTSGSGDMGVSLTFGFILVAVLGVVYQVAVKDLIFVTLGVGRDIRPIAEFNYQCRRIQDARLQACEDMWLSEQTRELFLACSDSLARSKWFPNIDRLNSSGRSTRDAIIAMDIDRPHGDGFRYRTLDTIGMPNINGNNELHLAGLTGISNSASTLLFFVNNRPSIDPKTGAPLDDTRVGANSTIEVFETAPRSTSINHLRTIVSSHITTPNNIAVLSRDKFYITNDHGPHKVGLTRTLSPFLKTGSVTYCNSTACTPAASGLSFPNGLAHSPHDGRLYVPSTWAGGVAVYAAAPGASRPELLRLVDTIPLPYPVDNLSVDADGAVLAAAIPRVTQLLASLDDPLRVRQPAATVFRIRREGGKGNSSSSSSSSTGVGGYVVEKVLEDRDGEVLPGATTAVHDVKTGRIFVSGFVAPFVTVCDPVIGGKEV